MIEAIEVNGEEYTVMMDFLHHEETPRLVLYEKEGRRHTCVTFNDITTAHAFGGAVVHGRKSPVKREVDGREYAGRYWGIESNRAVRIKIVRISIEELIANYNDGAR